MQFCARFRAMHISVLKDEIVENFKYLANLKEGVFFDGTLGLAGHSIEIAKINPHLTIIGLDKDDEAIKLAKEDISKSSLGDRFIIEKSDFKDFEDVLIKYKIAEINGALLDLGVSSLQLDDLNRGFSFKDKDQPLDMRMDQTQELDAKKILNTYNETELFKILSEFGEEKFARLIAKNITRKRKEEKIEKVSDLLTVLEQSIPAKFRKTGKIHFATRTFQALRIEVNKELLNLDIAINRLVSYLRPGAKLAIISFHSLEDRIVKNTFKKLADPCDCPKEMPCICGLKKTIRILTNKPILPSEIEIKQNSRSRSAKLRIIEKI